MNEAAHEFTRIKSAIWEPQGSIDHISNTDQDPDEANGQQSLVDRHREALLENTIRALDDGPTIVHDNEDTCGDEEWTIRNSDDDGPQLLTSSDSTSKKEVSFQHEDNTQHREETAPDDPLETVRRSARIKRAPRQFGLLTKPVKSIKDWPYDWKAAIANELSAHAKAGTFDIQEIIEHDDITERDAQVVRFRFIYGLKNWELGPARATPKARLVAQGCNLRSVEGAQLILSNEEIPYEVPASLQALRVTLNFALSHGHEIWISDIDYAYLHAPLLGPAVYMRVPQDMVKVGPAKIAPVVRLRKALYGLPRSGGDYNQYAREQLKQLGWTPTNADRNLYVRRSGDETYMLALYVDDILLAAPQLHQTKLQNELKETFTIQKGFQKVDDKGTRYMGMNFVRTNDQIVVSLPEYTKHVVDEFKLLRNTGESLKWANTPYLNKMNKKDLRLDEAGEYEEKAAKFIGMLLWLARTARPDVITAVALLSRHTHSWSKYADAMLTRIIEYIDRTATEGLTIKKLGKWRAMRAYSDADHAGCLFTSKSTTGYCCFLEDGNGKRSIIDWSSSKQGAVFDSTAASEIYALSVTLKAAVLPISMMLDEVGKPLPVTVYCDNEAAIKDTQHGYSKKLRYMHKIARVSLCFLHDLFFNKELGLCLEYVHTSENVADIFTKQLAAAEFTKHRSQL
ncbi:Copia protein [Porphyridium purpureum]|uniref:Copia protein n=1 Tax=Porphyridium purpureum TaxID=35688 RepID=A0A5J4Z2M0_PORPP|nr:Copia protein [Porphyridium purpureum]|eukprot:POR0914..scf208_2